MFTGATDRQPSSRDTIICPQPRESVILQYGMFTGATDNPPVVIQ